MTHLRPANRQRQGERPAVILGGSWNAVSVARSLGPRGIEVQALGDRPDRPVRYSRHCANYVTALRGEDVHARWLQWLRSDGPEGAVVLPCDDDGLELVARNRRELVDLGYLPIEADDDVALAMLDKERQYELAARIGVPAPRTAPVRSLEELDAVAGSFAYPCALKPLHSHLWARHFYGKVVVAADAGQLRAAFERTSALGIEVLVTEIVPGPESAYFGHYSYLDEHGEPLFHLTKQKLRQFPSGFGAGCYHVTDWDPEVAELGLRFMQGVGARGLSNVEFKRDARDGQLKLIELNYRFTAITELLRRSGADVAWLVYSRLVGRPLPPIAHYRRGVRFWYPMEDTRSALSSCRAGELPLAAWIRSIAHRQTFPLLSIDDPLPSVGYHAWLARRLLNKRLERRPNQAADPLGTTGPDVAAPPREAADIAVPGLPERQGLGPPGRALTPTRAGAGSGRPRAWRQRGRRRGSDGVGSGRG